MNKKAIFSFIFTAFFTLVLLLSPVFAEDELPVEIDIELLYETMTMDQARDRIKEDTDAGRITPAQANAARKAMRELTRQGISVNRAFESLQKALRQNRDLARLSSEKHIMYIKKQLIKEELRHQLMIKGKNRNQTEGALKNLEQLLEQGLSAKTALKAVLQNIGVELGPFEFDFDFNIKTGINGTINSNYDNISQEDRKIMPADDSNNKDIPQDNDKGNKKK